MTRRVRQVVSLATEGPKTKTETTGTPAIEKPEGVKDEAWAVAQAWHAKIVAGEMSVETIESTLTHLPEDMAEGVRVSLAELAQAEALGVEPTEIEEIEFYPEPTIVYPDGALVLHREEIGGVEVHLVRRPTAAETIEEAEAWWNLQTGKEGALFKVATELGNTPYAWRRTGVLISDLGVEEVVYPIVSTPDVPEGYEPTVAEVKAWYLLNEEGDEDDVVAFLAETENGDEEDARADLADIHQWPITNVPVLPERAEPDLPEGATPLDSVSLEAWGKLHVEGDPAKALKILTSDKVDPTSLAQAAARMAELVQIPARVVQFEVSVQEMHQRAGLDKKVEGSAETPGTTVVSIVTHKVTIQQLIGHLGLADAGGYKDVVTGWAIAQSGASTPEGVAQWLAAQQPDAANAVEFSSVKTQRQPKARDFFRTLRTAATKKYPEVTQAAEAEKAKPTTEPVKAEGDAAGVADKGQTKVKPDLSLEEQIARWSGLKLDQLRTLCAQADLPVDKKDKKNDLVQKLAEKARANLEEAAAAE